MRLHHKIVCISVFCLLSGPRLWGQLQLQWLGPAAGTLSSLKQSPLRVENFSTQAQEAAVILELRAQKGGRQAFNSQPISILPGEQVIAGGVLQYEEEHPVAPPSGNYQLCIQVRRRADQQLLGQTCVAFTVVKEEAAAQAPADRITLHGQARLSGQYSSLPPTENLPWPTRFVRLEAQPQIALLGLPFSGQVFVTASEAGFAADYQMIGLQLDPQQLRQDLGQKAEARLRQAEKWKAEGLVYDGALLHYLDSLKGQARERLENQYGFSPDALLETQIVDGMAAFDQYQRLDNILAHPSFQQLTTEAKDWEQRFQLPADTDWTQLQDSLCGAYPDQCGALSQWLSKQAEWEALQERKEALATVVQQYEPYLAMARDWKSQGDPRELLRQPEVLQQLPGVDRLTRWMSQVRKLGIGTTLPEYDPLSLSGVRVNGLDLGMALGKTYLQLTGGALGQMNMGFQPWDTLRKSVQQKAWLVGVKGGLGQTESNHLHVSYVAAWQAQTEQTDLFQRFIPRHSQVLGLGGSLRFWEERLLFEGTATQALAQVESLSEREAQTLQDQALRGRAQLALPRLDTRFEARYLQVGPDYFAMGAPLLRSSLVRYGLEWKQSLWDGKLETTAYFKRDDDPFQPYQFFRQSMETRGFRVQMQLDKWPTLSLDYAPYAFRAAGADSSGQAYQSSFLSAQSSYHLRLKQLSLLNTLQYAQFRTAPQAGQVGGKTHMLSASQSLSLGLPISFQMMATYLRTVQPDQVQEQLYLDLGAQGKWKKWTLGAGWQYAQEAARAEPLRNGGYLDLRFPMRTKLAGELRLEKNTYSTNPLVSSTTPPGLPDELRIRAAVRVVW